MLRMLTHEIISISVSPMKSNIRPSGNSKNAAENITVRAIQRKLIIDFHNQTFRIWLIRILTSRDDISVCACGYVWLDTSFNYSRSHDCLSFNISTATHSKYQVQLKTMTDRQFKKKADLLYTSSFIGSGFIWYFENTHLYHQVSHLL